MNITVPQRPSLTYLIRPQAGRSAEMQALWQWIVAEDAKDPDTSRQLTAQEGRALSARLTRRWNVDMPEMARIEKFSLPGLGGAPPIAAEMIVPLVARPGCILFVHGGGWAHCDMATHQRAMRLLAQEAGVPVLGINYRLAPEHPYPAPLEDVLAGWRWLVAEAGRNPALAGPLAIAGDSAGANLALSAIMRENELGRPAPHAGLLFYGIFSANLESPSYQRFATGYGLSQEQMRRFWDWYLPGSSPDAARYETIVNQVTAGEAVLAKLPPLFLNAAGLDVLLCDTLALAGRLETAGTSHELVIHEGVHHGFMQFSARLEEARRAFRLAGDYFRRTFA